MQHFSYPLPANLLVVHHQNAFFAHHDGFLPSLLQRSFRGLGAALPTYGHDSSEGPVKNSVTS
jgi:hypothetical protein